MNAPDKAQPKGTVLRSLRAVTGLYLLAYVTSHLVNLSLGLVSLEAMDAARVWLSSLWVGPLTGPFMGIALLIHYGLGLWSVYKRPSITGTTQDMVQALSGLAVIPLMTVHVVGTYMLKQGNVTADYDLLNRIFWLSNPGIGLLQVLLISVVWVHGCAGFFTLARAKPALLRALPWLYPLAVAVPVVALLGYTQAGRIILGDGTGPFVVQAALPDGTAPPPIDYGFITRLTNTILWLSILLSLLVLAARALRIWLSSPAAVAIHIQNVGAVTGHTGQNLLDALRHADQPHANLCAGRGRCGTCAVRILHSHPGLTPASAMEQTTLERVGLGADVRLACQLPLDETSALSVAQLYPPDFQFDDTRTLPEATPTKQATPPQEVSS